MSDFLIGWARELWTILAEAGPWLLVGFIIAGYLRALIREEVVFRHLGRDDLRSVLIASFVGAPLPLCSCSVIPSAVALKKAGASKGATSAFLIATPETGVDSIGITWALMDPIMTIARPLAAITTAITSGSLVNMLVRRGMDVPPAQVAAVSDLEPTLEELAHEHDHDHTHDHEPAATPRGPIAATRSAFHYAFGPLFTDLTPSFVFGFLLSALIAVLTPPDFFHEILPGGLTTMLVMLVIGIPIYVCDVATTPVAAVMIAKGLDPGAALVLLLAGPATNMATVAAVRSSLGTRVLWIYLASIALGAVGFGLLVNATYAALGSSPVDAAAGLQESSIGPVKTLAGIVLGLLIVWKALDLRLFTRWSATVRARLAPLGIDLGSPVMKAASVLVLFALWGSSSLGVVRPGEVGFRLRFGRVVEVLEQPGLAAVLPWPFERLEIVRKDEMRGLRLGGETILPFEPRTLAELTRAARDPRSEVVTGDENVLRLNWAVQWRVADAWRSLYATESPDQLLRALANASMTSAVAKRTTDDLLVGDREGLEAELIRTLQSELDALETGIEVVAVRLSDVHAPPEVHDAYRDVASAHEDLQRQLRLAERRQKELVAQARAHAHGRVQRAASAADAVLQRARGETAAFEALREAQALEPELFRARMRLDANEKALAGPELLFVLDPRIEIVPVERKAAPDGGAPALAPRPWER